MRLGSYLMLMAVLAGAVASGDVIRLKNGNSMEGIIRGETATDYQLDIGFGTMAIPKAQVAKVERSNDTQHAQMEEQRRQKFILHEKYAPAGQRDLLQDFQALEAQHAEALRLHARLNVLQAAFVHDQLELQQVNTQEAQLAAQLAATPQVPANMAVYNQCVAAINTLRAQMNELMRKPAGQLEEMNRCRQGLARFTTALLAFAERFQTRKATAASDSATADFFRAMETQLAGFKEETRQVRLPIQPNQRRVLVKARLNDQVDGTFLVDTGATSVTLTIQMAQRLQLATNSNEITVTLADGSICKAHTATLRSVEVQGARVEHLTAVIMPENPREDIDGLLGMNFLVEFNVHLDPASNTLILDQFVPH